MEKEQDQLVHMNQRYTLITSDMEVDIHKWTHLNVEGWEFAVRPSGEDDDHNVQDLEA